MTERCRVVLAEDHAVVREGLRSLLVAQLDCEIAGEAWTGRKAVALAEDLDPDLILMDLSMPDMNGIEATREIKAAHPDIKIVVLTVHKTDQHIRSALDAGADGYILKDSPAEELLLGIRRVLEGKRHLSSEVAARVIDGYLAGDSAAGGPPSVHLLTKREREILSMIGEGISNQEIADRVHISPKTVEKHRANIMKKLDLHSGSALTAFAIKEGLTET